MKECSTCKLSLPKTVFGKLRISPDGLNYICKSCNSTRGKKYYTENIESVREKHRIYASKNKEAASERSSVYQKTDRGIAYRKEYNKNHKEEMRAYTKKYYILNKERIDIKNRRFRLNNLSKCRHYTNKYRSSKLNRTPHWLTEDDYKWIAWMYKHASAMELATGVKHHVDHIVPLQGKNVSGLHCPLNLQILTQKENLSKSNHYEI